MRSVAFLFFLASVLLAADLRPPVPDVGYAEYRRGVLKQCKVPPQTVVLPPMVEPDWRDCANAYYKPEPAEAAYRLSLMTNSEAEVLGIEAAPGFVRAYEISAKVSGRAVRFLCDEDVNRCYEIGKVYNKPEKKDKK